MGVTDKLRARQLHSEGMACSEKGNDEGALEKYEAALKLDPERSETLYNIGLIYKYRRAWPESLDCNLRADVLAPDDEATLWNLAIAATALRDWNTARRTWLRLGIELGDGSGPIDDNFGEAPVRLKPHDAGEVVWAHRIDPVRARLINVPFSASGFRYGDVVLHDGAQVGTRLDRQGRERAVFNVLELFEASRFSTFEADIKAADPQDMTDLDGRCDASGLICEDWTQTVRTLCKACSEGRPHQHHDQDRGDKSWQIERRVGIACVNSRTVRKVLNSWCLGASGRVVMHLECTLRSLGSDP
jgi:TPR repeat